MALHGGEQAASPLLTEKEGTSKRKSNKVKGFSSALALNA